MSIEGRIAVDVSFADSATSSGVQSLKRITLTSTDSYAAGKVAILTGTCGTAQAQVDIPLTAYKDAAGNASTLTLPTRIAFSATGNNLVQLQDANGLAMLSKGGSVSVCDIYPADDSFQIRVVQVAGTASYTIVLYGT
jgi:hypothetical protein